MAAKKSTEECPLPHSRSPIVFNSHYLSYKLSNSHFLPYHDQLLRSFQMRSWRQPPGQLAPAPPSWPAPVHSWQKNMLAVRSIQCCVCPQGCLILGYNLLIWCSYIYDLRPCDLLLRPVPFSGARLYSILAVILLISCS
jgi:hypothetical protein